MVDDKMTEYESNERLLLLNMMLKRSSSGSGMTHNLVNITQTESYRGETSILKSQDDILWTNNHLSLEKNSQSLRKTAFEVKKTPTRFGSVRDVDSHSSDLQDEIGPSLRANPRGATIATSVPTAKDSFLNKVDESEERSNKKSKVTLNETVDGHANPF